MANDWGSGETAVISHVAHMSVDVISAELTQQCEQTNRTFLRILHNILPHCNCGV